MFKDQLKLTGNVFLEIVGADGRVKTNRSIKNLIVTSGKTFIASSLLKTTTNTPLAMTHMAIGQGSTPAVLGDTALASEIGRSVLTSSASSGAVVTYVGTFGPGVGTGSVYEAGIFNGATATTVGQIMLCRTVFAVVTKAADDSMTVTWNITVS